MRTPCQNDPEIWVSDFAESRREAARLCIGCPRITACGLEAMENLEAHGVWGGMDFSKVDALATVRKKRRAPNEPAPTKLCEDCGGQFTRTYHSTSQWERARFCGKSCANAVNARKGKAA